VAGDQQHRIYKCVNGVKQSKCGNAFWTSSQGHKGRSHSEDKLVSEPVSRTAIEGH
jgi:hypothetical protein